MKLFGKILLSRLFAIFMEEKKYFFNYPESFHVQVLARFTFLLALFHLHCRSCVEQLTIASHSDTFQADKILISLSIRHLPYQKFRIILNIVLIVNEFECCVSFPAAPILRRSSTTVSTAFACVGFLQFSSRNFASKREQKTLSGWKRKKKTRRKHKISYVYNE